MATVPNAAAILRDDNGNFYLLTPELLEQARATPEMQAAIEAALVTDDTGGHIISNVSNVPAATLLLPYFEVSLDRRGNFTLFTPSVTPPTNTTGQPPGRRR
jgi:hypothetical protein